MDRGTALALLDRLEESHFEQDEFRPTRMSHALGKAIIDARFALNLTGGALDVGTGCGLHAILMARIGLSPVQAIDCSHTAIDKAKARAASFTADSIQFKRENLKEWNIERNQKWSLITFNPPAYFRQEEDQTDSPLCHGLFSDHDINTREAKNPKKSALYYFFDKIVIPHLDNAGIAICTWPGIERRVTLPAQSRKPVHPKTLLSGWFSNNSWDSGDRNAKSEYGEFYTERVRLPGSAYGLDRFGDLLDAGIAAGVYARPPIFGRDHHGGAFYFKFGVLWVKREGSGFWVETNLKGTANVQKALG